MNISTGIYVDIPMNISTVHTAIYENIPMNISTGIYADINSTQICEGCQYCMMQQEQKSKFCLLHTVVVGLVPQ